MKLMVVHMQLGLLVHDLWEEEPRLRRDGGESALLSCLDLYIYGLAVTGL